MPAKWVKGHTFTDGETVNDSDLHEHLESATVSGIDRANIDSTDGFPGVIQLTMPGDLEEKEPYAHSDVLWWVSKDSSGNPLSCRVGGYNVILSASSATVEPGELVQAGGLNSGVIEVSKSGTAAPGNVLGIAATRMTASSRGVVIAQGITAVRTASDAAAALVGKGARQSSSEDGQAAEMGAAGSGGGKEKFGTFLSDPFTGESGDKYAWVSLFR
jgi:hypothetical protein